MSSDAALLAVLMHRAMLRLSALCPTLQPRQLVDDVSLQWVGPANRSSQELGEGIDQLTFDLASLKLPIQIKKLGHVASSSRAARRFRMAARARRIKGLPWIRNLGHELGGPKVRRQQEVARLEQLRGRVRRSMILKKAVGARRMTRIQTAGLTPSVAHGASVSGVADAALKQIRSVAAMLAGVLGGHPRTS